MDIETNDENISEMNLDDNVGDFSDMDIDSDQNWKDRGTLISASHSCQFSLGELRKMYFLLYIKMRNWTSPIGEQVNLSYETIPGSIGP